MPGATIKSPGGIEPVEGEKYMYRTDLINVYDEDGAVVDYVGRVTDRYVFGHKKYEIGVDIVLVKGGVIE